MKTAGYFLILFNIAAAQVNVHIESVPSGASIVIDGKSVGQTPQYNIRLKPGVHSIELEKRDYVPIKWKTVLQEAVKAEFTFRMKALFDVQFISKERGLRYKLNDGIEWIDKRVQFKMEEGVHEFMVYRGGELIDKQTINIFESTKIIYALK